VSLRHRRAALQPRCDARAQTDCAQEFTTADRRLLRWISSRSSILLRARMPQTARTLPSRC
jgi:hypothetical protein